MSLVPSIRTNPPSVPEPFSVEVTITRDDWLDATLHVQREVVVRQRRALLVTVGVLVFLTLLGLLSNWITETDDKSLGGFVREMGRVSFAPVAAFLLVVGVLSGIAYWLWPARIRANLRFLAGSDFARPLPVRYRFDEAGFVREEPHRSAFVPWRWLKPLEETDRYLFLPTGYIEEPSFLPKRDCTAEDLARVQAFANARIGGTAPPTFPGVATEAPVRLAYALTAEDRAAAIMRQQELPKLRRQRLRGFALTFVGFSLIWPAFYAFAWVVDPYRVPFADAFPLYLEMFADEFWQPTLALAVALGLLMLVHRRLRMASAQRLGAYLHERARQGEIQVSIGEDGVATAMEESRGFFEWAAFRGCERTGTHILLPLFAGTVVPLPLRAFDPETLRQFDEIAGRHLGGETGAKP